MNFTLFVSLFTLWLLTSPNFPNPNSSRPMIVQLWRCPACGDTYIGAAQPPNCPFCGIDGHQFILVKEWVAREGLDIPVPNLTEVSIRNIKESIVGELADRDFYRSASETTDLDEAKRFFKFVSKIENEHASLLKKMLKFAKIDLPEPLAPETTTDLMDSLDRSFRREEEAVILYKRFAEEATEERVKYVFENLAEVEASHSCIGQDILSRYGPEPKKSKR
jgi:rubrerythrin